MFISQSLNQDGSFQNRVNKLALHQDDKISIEQYPQSKSQKEGLGFPICRIVAIISLVTGSIIDANIGTYSGTGIGEQTLLRSIISFAL